jgi:hypothetical protein
MQRCVPASAFQHLCSSICVSASVCQHLRLCFSFYVPAPLVRVDILDCSITDCHQWHSLTVFVISCVAAFVSVFQQLCSSICVSASVLQHLCFSIYVSASVLQHLCFSICLLASMFQHLCSSTCVCSISNRLPSMTILDPVFVISCVAAFVSVFQRLLCVLHKQSIAINDNLNHLLQSSIIVISPTISPFGIDGNMSFISPPLTSRAKG